MSDLDILLILDRSGSMQERKADHEGGVRSFVEDQRQLEGDVRFTLVQFDTNDPCEIVYDRVPITAVGPIHLIPRGGTPLLDAVGKAVAHLRLRQTTEPSASGISSGRSWPVERSRMRNVSISEPLSSADHASSFWSGECALPPSWK